MPASRRRGDSQSSFSRSRPTSLPGTAPDTRRALHAQERIADFFSTLSTAWGPQHWWPAQTPFEVVVGAYLTQNTAWTNVERALAGLREAKLLDLDSIRHTPLRQVEKHIHSAGYFRQKAHRLKLFVEFLDRNFAGSLEQMFATPTQELRARLLSLHGVGPETADSILLYAANHPVFVVDAYTRRILARHRLVRDNADYEEIRQLVESALAKRGVAPALTQLKPGYGGAAHHSSPVSAMARSSQVQILNEMHALIVGVGKDFCRKSAALCEHCPLQPLLEGPPRKAAALPKRRRRPPRLSSGAGVPRR